MPLPKVSKPHISKNAQGWYVRWMDWAFITNPPEWVEHTTFEYPTWKRAWLDYKRCER